MTVLTVADLTVTELKNLIREVTTQTLMELLSDPDVGLELGDEFENQLQRSLETAQAGGKTTPAQEVAQRLGLEW